MFQHLKGIDEKFCDMPFLLGHDHDKVSLRMEIMVILALSIFATTTAMVACFRVCFV
jgi:hypothetical protein